MTESVDDGTEGGYTAYSSEEFEQWFTNLPTDEQKAYVDRITVLSGPVEYTYSYTHTSPSLSEEYQKALIEKYGHIPELNQMVAVEEQPDD